MLLNQKISSLFLKKKFLLDVIFVTVIVIFSLAINWKSIQEGVIFETPDLHIHITWLQHFSKQLNEGIFYPRWLAGANYGYGSPAFIFYPPLVYYVGSALMKIGLNTERAVVALFVIAVFLSCFNFYIYACNRWSKIASFLGAVTYGLMPYITYNITHRGALAESWAIALAPLGLLATDKALSHPKWRSLVTLFFVLISLTHAPSLLIYTIFWFAYVLCLYKNHPAKDIVMILIYALIGFGIACFYLIPAILEQDLVSISSMKGVTGGWSNHIINFPPDNKTKGHIFSFYTYGSVSVIILSTLSCYINIHNNKPNRLKETITWTIFGLSILFFMCYLSSPIWQFSSILQMIQFPWRLMGLLSLSIAGLMTITVSSILEISNPQKYLKFIIVGLFAIVTILFFYSKYSSALITRYDGFYNPGSFDYEITKSAWKIKSFEKVKTALSESYDEKLKGVPEYLPLKSTDKLTVAMPLIGQPPVSVINGDALILNLDWKSYKRIFKVKALTDSLIKIRTYYYPVWHLRLNNQPQEIKVAEDGTILFYVPKGEYEVKLIYVSTLDQKVGVFISILSLILLIVINWISVH